MTALLDPGGWPADGAVFSLLCVALACLVRWAFALLAPSSDHGGVVKAPGRGGAAPAGAGPDALAALATVGADAGKAPALADEQDGEGRRAEATCGLWQGGGSDVTVERFGKGLQRLIRECYDLHGTAPSRLRMFDDFTVRGSLDREQATLTECRATQFRRLRAAADLSEVQYCESMCSRPFSGGKVEASGKSGSFFLRTHDSKFVLKTIEEHEFQVLKDVLPHMVLYLQEHHESLLCRFLGGYYLQVGGRMVRFVVMANVLPLSADEVYDLKGTTEDRWVDPSTGGVMKDNNFAPYRLLLADSLCERITRQIRDDAEFLYSLGVMDYSLLVGVSAPNATDSGSSDLSHVRGWLSTGSKRAEPRMFQLGIIDYLQRWTPKKVAAHWLKKSTLGCFHEIDTEPPAVYYTRFYKYFFEKIQIMAL